MFAEKFQGLSQREKVLVSALGIVVFIAFLTYVTPLVLPQQPASAAVGIPSPDTSTMLSKPLTAPVPKIHTENIKDPFRTPPTYQVKKEKIVGEHAPPRNNRQSLPVLHGVISSEKAKMVILEWHDNSETLGIGGSIGEYTVTAIADNQVVLEGLEGQVALYLGR